MEINLPGEPVSTNTIYRYTCVGGFLRGYMSKEGKAKKEEYSWLFKSGRPKRWSLALRYCVTVRLYFKNNRTRDVDNYCKILFDAAKGILWDDDNQISEMHVSKFIDKANPRLEMDVKIVTKDLSTAH